MPIYEYKCVENGHEFEVLQSVGEAAPKKCKHCDSKVEKLISRSAFHLKGSGWYTTDYKSQPAANNKADDKDDKKESKTAASNNKPAESKAANNNSTDAD